MCYSVFMGLIGRPVRSFWRWFKRPPRVTKGQWLRDWAWGFLSIPVFGMPIAVVALLDDPRVFFEAPLLFILLVVMPLGASAILFKRSRTPENLRPLD